MAVAAGAVTSLVVSLGVVFSSTAGASRTPAADILDVAGDAERLLQHQHATLGLPLRLVHGEGGFVCHGMRTYRPAGSPVRS